jgi:hypothetical protein
VTLSNVTADYGLLHNMAHNGDCRWRGDLSVRNGNVLQKMNHWVALHLRRARICELSGNTVFGMWRIDIGEIQCRRAILLLGVSPLNALIVDLGGAVLVDLSRNRIGKGVIDRRGRIAAEGGSTGGVGGGRGGGEGRSMDRGIVEVILRGVGTVARLLMREEGMKVGDSLIAANVVGALRVRTR